ncbi:P-loop NTPase fold protein [Acinetobacter faecalis]|uniref:KAP family P-loop NTPase fold protein n=1 Tax=Acinetobacter faecalis TaxID=2665161 RepID=UPI002A909DFF|nr:P-loop NTPase fold protein [Acinetobacter faecalis]MDY6481908.1 P-loop NTPase fold protein [Acinetobacter faecalis]
MVNDQLKWDKDNFENIEEAWKGDLWDRRRLGEQLTQYVDRLQCGAVLALDAKWGEGKTWFVRNWAKHLDETNHNVIYLDAFANDYLDDPFLVITSEIANILKKDKSTKNSVNKLIELSASVGTALLPSLPKVALTIGLHLVGAGLLSGVLQQGYENAKDGIDALSDEASERIKESIQEKIAGHEAEKETLKEFKKHLADTVEKLENPLVFIIDELDRCRPDFAIRLIERIKHFFDIPKIVFVLVMNKPQLLQSVKSFYGYGSEMTEDYFEKFIDLTIKFPNNGNLINYETILKEELYRIGEVKNREEFNEFYFWVLALQLYKKYNSRELKRKINQYAILKTNDNKKNLVLIAFVFDVEFSKNLKFYSVVLTKLAENLNHYIGDSKYLGNTLINKLRNEYSIIESNIGYLYNMQVNLNEKYRTAGQQEAKEFQMLEIYKPFAICELKQSDDFISDWKNYVESGFNLNN